MKVTGTKTETTNVNVDVNPLEVFQQIRSHILTTAHLRSDAFERDGKLFYEREIATSHVSWHTEEISNPTLEQVALVKALDLIEKHVQGMK